MEEFAKYKIDIDYSEEVAQEQSEVFVMQEGKLNCYYLVVDAQIV
jgi:hypothetical protein